MNPSQFPPISNSTQPLISSSSPATSSASPLSNRNVIQLPPSASLRNIYQTATPEAQQPFLFPPRRSASNAPLPPRTQDSLENPLLYQDIGRFERALNLAYPPSSSQAASSTSSSAANPIFSNETPEDLSQFISQTESRIKYIELFISKINLNEMYIPDIKNDFNSKIDILTKISSEIDSKIIKNTTISESKKLDTILKKTNTMIIWLKEKLNQFQLNNINHISPSTSSVGNIAVGGRAASTAATSSKRARKITSSRDDLPVIDLTEDQIASSSSSSSSSTKILPPPKRRAPLNAAASAVQPTSTSSSSSSTARIDLTHLEEPSSSSVRSGAEVKKMNQTVQNLIRSAKTKGLDWFVNEVRTIDTDIVRLDRTILIVNLLFCYAKLKNNGKRTFELANDFKILFPNFKPFLSSFSEAPPT